MDPTLTDVGCTYKLMDRALSTRELKNIFRFLEGDGTIFLQELMIYGLFETRVKRKSY
jgi:hypothetical protein